MNKISKIIRILTVAPVFAAFATTLLYFSGNSFFKNSSHYIVSLITLTVFPLLAYPISLIKNKKERRNFQRSLAIVFAIMGYICGLVYSVAASSPSEELILYSTYLLSGLAIGFSSFVLKKKSSGHACGIAGPVSILVYFISPLYAFAYLLLIPVCWASLQMKRHTLSQLITGTVIPVISMFVCIFIFK